MDEKLIVLLNITRIAISVTLKKKINNIIKWSKNSKNWYGIIMWVHKLPIKISNNFDKVRQYIVHKGTHLLQSYVTT